ncbi:mitochondrial 50S ribosomal protein L5 [Panus rudis PR-1116 ss-1]|nr:mitochondrial 50S ribosomal protein L5 [Panus rudis PR-1116 ss-1]
MGAAIATAAKTAAQSSGRRRAGRLLQPPKPLQRDRNGLPIPHVNIVVRDTHQSRLQEHYYNTLRDDLMYMTYKHEAGPRKPERPQRLRYDPEDPYTKHRFNPPLGGNKWFKQQPPPTTAENVIKLERIQLHTMLKSAVTNRSNLLTAIMAFRAISGESLENGGRHTTEGVQIVKARTLGGKGWARRGQPIGVKVDLKGPQMYDFIGTLTDFVLPRLREFNGIVMDGPGSPLDSPSGATGVVSFGLPPYALGFFPQIEVNVDAYPELFGMHIHFITDAVGVGAQNRARALVSGFQIPFARA